MDRRKLFGCLAGDIPTLLFFSFSDHLPDQIMHPLDSFLQLLVFVPKTADLIFQIIDELVFFIDHNAVPPPDILNGVYHFVQNLSSERGRIDKAVTNWGKTVIASYGNLSYNGEISRTDDRIEVYYGIGAE